MAIIRPVPKTRMFYSPGFPYGIMFSSQSHRLPGLFDRDGVEFYLRASTALWHGLKILGLSPGSTILLPSYHCGIELDVIGKAGFQIAFYRIGRDLSIDLDDLRRLDEPGTRALYVIHYFGFPHDLDELRQFCDARGWALIEDCAQSLFAEAQGRPAGSTGDFAIFSFRKCLPMPYGGALVVNNDCLGRSPATVPPPSPLVLGEMIDILGRNVTRSAFMNASVSRGFRGFVSQVIQRWATQDWEEKRREEASGPPPFQSEWKDVRMPGVSRWVLQRIAQQQVIERRRSNFATLLDHVSGCQRVTPLIPELSDGACPGFFPVTVAGGVREFLQCSRDHGVPAFVLWRHAHPEFPRARFPEAIWLKKNVVVLPVHQGLGADDLVLLRELIHGWEQAGP